MRSGSPWVIVLALLAPAMARAGEELTAQEKSWAKTCVEGLMAPTPRQRESAAAALGRLGTAALPTVLAQVARFKTDEPWGALERACVAMGAQDAVKALETARSDWPKACATRLQTLLDRLREQGSALPAAGAPGAPGAPLPPAPAGVAGEVERILASFEKDPVYSPSDPRVDRLAAMGRGALAPLLAELRGEGMRRGYRENAAQDALERIATVDDLPVLTQALEDGHLRVAPALKRLPPDRAVPVLLGPVAKGRLDHHLMEALEAFERDPRVRPALLAWLEKQAGDGDSSVCASVAGCLARLGATEAIPLLSRIARDPGFPLSMRAAASAVADLGDKGGVLALIDFFRVPPGDGHMSAWDRHEAGEHLNRIVGRAVYRGSAGMPSGVDPQGNFDEAGREFLAWWEKSKATLRYDKERRAWLTGK